MGEIGENAIIVFEENVGVGAEEIVANQEYVAYKGDNDDVIQVILNINPNCHMFYLIYNYLSQAYLFHKIKFLILFLMLFFYMLIYIVGNCCSHKINPISHIAGWFIGQ